MIIKILNFEKEGDLKIRGHKQYVILNIGLTQRHYRRGRSQGDCPTKRAPEGYACVSPEIQNLLVQLFNFFNIYS